MNRRITIKLPIELHAIVLLPEATSVADVLNFLRNDGIGVGLGEAVFHTLTTETRDLDGEEAMRARRDGAPTLHDLSAMGEDTFREGFRIVGPSGVIAFQGAAGWAWAVGEWDPNSDEPRPSGWRLVCRGNQRFSPATDESFRKSEYPDIFRRNLEGCLAFARAAVNTLPVETALVKRKDTAARCPLLPLVQFDNVLFAAKPEAIAEDYADLEAFAAAWDEAESLGNGLSLFTRGTEIQDQDAFWRNAIEVQLDLARAAKPGRIQYPAPRLNPTRQEMIANLPRYLEQVGYDPNTETIEFTAYVPDGEHLGVRDIYELAGLKRDGLPGGEPLKGVIVTFADETMAKREARPLFDMGLTVQYFGQDGAFHVLEPIP